MSTHETLPRVTAASGAYKARRVAIILPLAYHGGVLRGLRNIARMVAIAQIEDDARSPEVVIAVPAGVYDVETEFVEEAQLGITIREVTPRLLGKEAISRVASYAQMRDFELEFAVHYRDGVCDLLDCDVWLVVTNRAVDEFGAVRPILPIRPVVLIPYDFIEHYVPEVLPPRMREDVALVTRQADLVVVTQPQTGRDAVSFVGCDSDRIVLVPIDFEIPDGMRRERGDNNSNLIERPTDKVHFIWPTNTSVHKNHEVVFNGLRTAVDSGIPLAGVMTGTSVDRFLLDSDKASSFGHLFLRSWKEFQRLRMSEICVPEGFLDEGEYANRLNSADFAIHSSSYDNGAFALIEAAYCGVPSVCSDYPQSRFMAETFQIPAVWFKPDDPRDFVRALEELMAEYDSMRVKLPSRESLDAASWRSVANQWWSSVATALARVGHESFIL